MKGAVINLAELRYSEEGRLLFTAEMKEEYKVLVPQMAPFHFDLLVEALIQEGFKAELLDNIGPNLVNEGLKYVHNDSCYPAILVIGQILDAIKNRGYDSHKVAVIITQTGGGCRASNYIHLLRAALKKSGLSHIPVISLNISKLEKNPGFNPSYKFWFKAIWSVVYGDLLMQLYNEVKPYEISDGESDRLVEQWKEQVKYSFQNSSVLNIKALKQNIESLIKDFARIPVADTKLPRVGIVGEIYVKYSSVGNNNLEDYLREENVEIVIPPLMDFLLFKLDYRALEVDWYGGKFIKKFGINLIIRWIEKLRDHSRDLLQKAGFTRPIEFVKLRQLVKGIVSRGNRMGEGWLLTAEMIELIKSGAPNIVCAQPFGCLPNHISGKGVLKTLKDRYPEANIVVIDYDPGASAVNQKNRIKLMLSNINR